MGSIRPAVRAVVLAVGCLSACGGDDDDCVPGGGADAETGDGCRLSARTLSFADGEAVQIGWRDEDLDAACEFGEAGDGQLRCLPERVAGLLGRFSSPDCAPSSALVAVVPICGGDAPAFTAILDYASCPIRTRIFRVGAEHTGDVFSGTGPSSCREVEPSADFASYQLGEEVEPDELVAAERQARGEGRLQTYVLAAEDGARQPTGQFRDTELGDDCRFDLAADGSPRCLPGEFELPSNPGAFLDDACTEEVGIAPSCSQSTFALRPTRSEACGLRWLSYELGEPIDATGVFVNTDGTCSGESIVPDEGELRVVRPVEGDVEPSTLVGAEEELRGNGRVRARWAVVDDGAGDVFLGWFDTLLDSRCEIVDLGDGATACAPVGPMGVVNDRYFSDADCTEPVAVASGGSPACAALDGAIADQWLEGCLGYRYFETTGPVEGALFEIGLGPSCQPVGDADRARLRALGDEIDPATFERPE